MSRAGIYVHIPFCHKICHYCDFAKTANFTKEQQQAYVTKVIEQLKIELSQSSRCYTSLYFGGGTPSVVGSGLRPIIDVVRDKLLTEVEITLEINPLDANLDSLKEWRDMGINRLSLGVQSVRDQHLTFLTRDHNAKDALDAIETCLTQFKNINVDLIYGLKEQTVKEWEEDLTTLIAQFPEIAHFSLYALTFEGESLFNKKKKRGLMNEVSDELSVNLYSTSCNILRDKGYCHEEVSNWARPGFLAVHNSLYWSDDCYIGVGSGAHGYEPDPHGIGTRYKMTDDFRHYLKQHPQEQKIFDDARTQDSWLFEKVGTCLRSQYGLSIDSLTARGFSLDCEKLRRFHNNEGPVFRLESGVIYLSRSEWFRETYWSGIVCDLMKFLIT